MRVALFAAAVWLTSSAPAANAQDDTYRRLAEDATLAMSEHRLDDALSIFREMHAIQPSARTFWSLGRVHHELGRHVLAIDFLDRALEDPRRALDVEQRREASELRARAEALTGVLELHVQPANATVLVDDVELRAESPGVIRRTTQEHSDVTFELRLDSLRSDLGAPARLQSSTDSPTRRSRRAHGDADRASRCARAAAQARRPSRAPSRTWRESLAAIERRLKRYNLLILDEIGYVP